MSKMIQCEFSQGTARTTAFIPDDSRIKPGVSVELIDPETKERSWWTVSTVSQPVERESIKRGWNNNI